MKETSKIIPLPKRYNFNVLKEHGESVLIQCSKDKISNVRQAAAMYGKYHGFKVVTRQEDGGLRIWRGDDIPIGAYNRILFCTPDQDEG